VGCGVGHDDGTGEGTWVGFDVVCLNVGATDGCCVGSSVGCGVGSSEGCEVGTCVGAGVG
jgi:hypothetical protein